jgi:hypothetical protein
MTATTTTPTDARDPVERLLLGYAYLSGAAALATIRP